MMNVDYLMFEVSVDGEKRTKKEIVNLIPIKNTDAPHGTTHIADGQFYKLRNEHIFIWRDEWVNKRVAYSINKVRVIEEGKPKNHLRDGKIWSSEETAILKSYLTRGKTLTFEQVKKIAHQIDRSASAVIRRIRYLTDKNQIEGTFEQGLFYKELMGVGR